MPSNSYSPEQYQRCYADGRYGRAAKNACPGVRYLPLYQHWLRSPVFDLGAGTGDTLRAMRALGHSVAGYDWIELDPEVSVMDITYPLPICGGTVVCCDVLEHIPDDRLEGLLDNASRAHRQVFTVATFSHRYQGVELHVNLKPMSEWERVLGNRYGIYAAVSLGKHRKLYLCGSEA